MRYKRIAYSFLSVLIGVSWLSAQDDPSAVSREDMPSWAIKMGPANERWLRKTKLPQPLPEGRVAWVKYALKYGDGILTIIPSNDLPPVELPMGEPQLGDGGVWIKIRSQATDHALGIVSLEEGREVSKQETVKALLRGVFALGSLEYIDALYKKPEPHTAADFAAAADRKREVMEKYMMLLFAIEKSG